MVVVRVALFLFSFVNIVDCRVGQSFLRRKLEKHQSYVENGFTNGSKIGFAVGNGTVDFKASCSFSGVSWDPLLNCFDGRGPIDDVIRYHLLCKLKKELAFETQVAWSHAASFEANAPSNKNGSSLHRVVKVNDNDYKFRNQTDAGTDHQSMERLTYPEHVEKLRKCAVVSNSGVLRQHGHGDAIDNADLVLRFNDAPLLGWDRHVGTKESIRLVNGLFPDRVLTHVIAKYDFNANALYGIVSNGKVANLNGLRDRYPRTSIKLLSPALLKSFENTLQSIYDGDWFHNDGVSFRPTTGAIGMLSAMSRCDEVLAYGMAATSAARNSPYHYYKEEETYSAQKADENSWHRSFKAEKDLWRRLARNAPGEIDKTDVAVIPGFSQIKCD